MKTREDFIRDWRHEIEGWMLDAAMGARTGGELSLFLRSMRAKIETKLGLMHADALKGMVLPLEAKPANGATAQKK